MSLQYLSRSSIHCLAGLPCRIVLSSGLQVVTREIHRSLRRLICPAQDHFICLTLLIISMAFVISMAQTWDFLSLYVMLSMHTSFHFGLCGRTFVLLLFGECPGLYTICHTWQHTFRCLFVHMARLRLKTSRCLAYAAQPAMTLRFIYWSWLFSLLLRCCPRYS